MQLFSSRRDIALSLTLLLVILGENRNGYAIAENTELKPIEKDEVDYNNGTTIQLSSTIASTAPPPSSPPTTVPIPTTEPPNTAPASSSTAPSTVTLPASTTGPPVESSTVFSTEGTNSTTQATGSSTEITSSTPSAASSTENPSSTSLPDPPIPKKAGAPTWAIVLISILLSFAGIFTGLYFLRRYMLRKRQFDRRRLLSRGSQEGFFMGSSDATFDNGRL